MRLLKKLLPALNRARPGASRRGANRGEDTAVRFLKKKGFCVLERNYRSKYGEIDIVCEDGETVCFVEVKSRSTFNHGLPQEFVDRRKRKKITLAALQYIREKRPGPRPMRFDVVAVDLTDGAATLIEGAFEAEPGW